VSHTVRRVLWVEDEYARNKPFFEVLHGLGLEIRFASSVAEAIGLLEQDLKFELALVDLNLPLGPGIEHLELEDCNLNGKYLLEILLDACRVDIRRLLCFTNYWEDAKSSLEGMDVDLIPKTISLDDFSKRIKKCIS